MFLSIFRFILLFVLACILYSAPSLVSVSAAPLTDFPVGSEPKTVAIGDFNNDGKKDLAVCNRGSESISILLGDGAGSFAAAANFNVSPEPLGLAIGDFNNDGKSDVMVSSPNVHKISLMLGDGNGGLGTPVGFSVGENPARFAVGDFNADGNSDLAVADFGFNQGGVYILLGTGTGNFGAATKFTSGRIGTIVIRDFNADGKSDLAAVNGANKVSILLGNGSGGFGTPTDFATGSSPGALVVADFDQDTFLDLAVANMDSHNVSILKGNGQGSFGAAVNFPASSFPSALAAGDFNGDGKLDLAVGRNSTDQRISILLGNNSGQFGPPADFSTGSWPYHLVSDDLNNDGKSDIVTANGASNNVSVILGSLPSISINNVSLTEGDTGTKPATFTVTLSSVTNKPVTFVYGFGAGTADGISDFNNSGAGSLVTIPAGSLTATITVPILGDHTFEPDETLTVALASQFNAFMSNSQGPGTIVNDDPLPSITVHDASTVEGNSGSRFALFDVELSNDSYQPVFVTVVTSDRTAVANIDYIHQAVGVTFNPSETTKSIGVLIKGDTISEPNETFLVNASNPIDGTIARAQAVFTILDDDAPALLSEANSQRAIALDSVLMFREPFTIVNNLNFSSDHRSRIMLFAVDLNLTPNDVITVQAQDAQQMIYQLPVEYVGPVQNLDGLTQLVVRLPDQLANAGEVKVSFTLRGVSSNQVLLSITP